MGCAELGELLAEMCVGLEAALGVKILRGPSQPWLSAQPGDLQRQG